MNHVSIYGRLVDDDVRAEKDDQGTQVCFTISNLRRVDNDHKEITYVAVRAYDWLADIVARNGHKGDFLLVEGKLVQNEVPNRDGTKTYLRLEIEATRVMFLEQRTLDFPPSYTKKNLRNNRD